MKNRKIVIVAFLLVAVLLLGIGYAALTTYLNIHGGATVSVKGAESAFSADVKFTEATVIEAKDGDKTIKSTDLGADLTSMATAGIGDGKSASFDITGLKGADDYVKIQYTIKNTGDLDATIALDITTVNDDYHFDMEIYDSSDTEWTANTQKELASNNEIIVVVKVTLLNTPTNATTPTMGDFVIRLKVLSEEVTATSQQQPAN